MSRNAKYYKTWVVETTEYRLTFVPSDSSNVSGSYTELPSECIFEQCIIESNFEDDVFVGMPLADTMDLEIDLLRAGKGTATAQNFASYIDTDLASKTVNSVSMSIPNLWILEKRAAGAVNWDAGNATILFIGCQDSKPAIEYEIKADAVKAKIKVVSLLRAAMERTTIDMIKPVLTGLPWAKSTTDIWDFKKDSIIVDYAWTDRAVVSKILPAETIRFDTIENLMISIETNLNSVIEALTRGLYSFELAGYDDLIKAWLFLKPDLEAASNVYSFSIYPAAAELDETTMYYIPYVENTNASTLTTVAGLFDSNTKNPTFFEYKNIWDLFKVLAENFGVKASVSYAATLDYIYLKFAKLLDTTQTVPTLAKANIKEVFELFRKGENTVNEVIITYRDIKGEDVEDVTYGGFWTQAEGSYEIELVLHNGAMAYEGEDFAGFLLSKYRYAKSNIAWRNLYCTTTFSGVDIWAKVGGGCRYDAGDGNTFDTTTIPAPDTNTNNTIFKNNIVTNANARQLYSSMAYPLAQGLNYVFGNPSQGLITIKVNTGIIDHRQLGNMVSFDVNTMIDGYSFNFKEPGDFTNTYNLVITAVKSNYINNESEVTLFIRGD